MIIEVVARKKPRVATPKRYNFLTYFSINKPLCFFCCCYVLCHSAVLINSDIQLFLLCRKARKVEQKGIRSSPRFIVKENVNTGPSCESKAATASAVEGEKDVSDVCHLF